MRVHTHCYLIMPYRTLHIYVRSTDACMHSLQYGSVLSGLFLETPLTRPPQCLQYVGVCVAPSSLVCSGSRHPALKTDLTSCPALSPRMLCWRQTYWRYRHVLIRRTWACDCSHTNTQLDCSLHPTLPSPPSLPPSPLLPPSHPPLSSHPPTSE